MEGEILRGGPLPSLEEFVVPPLFGVAPMEESIITLVTNSYWIKQFQEWTKNRPCDVTIRRMRHIVHTLPIDGFTIRGATIDSGPLG